MACGVDEAGRGPVIGPMVIAGVCAPRDELTRIGVKDSKKLTPRRREALAEKIRKIADKVVVKVVEPEEIDRLRDEMNINEIEVIIFSEVIRELDSDEIYVDAADVDEERFSREIARMLGKDVKIISKHKADSLFPEVSAASIIAKVTRDKLIEEIKKELGEFGSGYPADPRTYDFLRRYYREHGDLPPHVRRSWKSAKKVIREEKQSRLEDF